MKRAPARWEADNPAAYEQGTRSFWLNAFVSQWASWESIILKYLNAIGSTRKMQVVYNTCFGELWEDRGDLEDEDSLMARRENTPPSCGGRACSDGRRRYPGRPHGIRDRRPWPLW